MHHVKRDNRCVWLSTIACWALVVGRAIHKIVNTCRKFEAINTSLYAVEIRYTYKFEYIFRLFLIFYDNYYYIFTKIFVTFMNILNGYYDAYVFLEVF